MALVGVEALIFDVFGTVVDWRSSVIAELKDAGKRHNVDTEETSWIDFAQEWRAGYMTTTRSIAHGGSGPSNVDVMHREILDKMLGTPRWSHLGSAWDEQERQNLNMVWHRLNGWPDAVEGLEALKKQTIIVPLSNGNFRLLLDMAKHAKLPWDAIFSTELFDTFKPNPKAYLEAARHLSLPPEKCAMVAAHYFDLKAAASQGMNTIYVDRGDESIDVPTHIIKSKKDGGDVDVIVESFLELAQILPHNVL